MEYEELYIIGYKNKLIRATQLKSNFENHRLAVIFPGYAYTVQGPILYFSKQLFENIGYDVLTIEYEYNKDNDFITANDDEKNEWFKFDILAIINTLKKYNQYKQYVFLGKSMGTTALFHIAQTDLFKPAKYIWVTPDSSFEDVFSYINCFSSPSLILAGSKDPYFRFDQIPDLGDKVKIKIFNEAGHSLEVQNDVYSSMINVKESIMEIDKFISQTDKKQVI